MWGKTTTFAHFHTFYNRHLLLPSSTNTLSKVPTKVLAFDELPSQPHAPKYITPKPHHTSSSSPMVVALKLKPQISSVIT